MLEPQVVTVRIRLIRVQSTLDIQIFLKLRLAIPTRKQPPAEVPFFFCIGFFPMVLLPMGCRFTHPPGESGRGETRAALAAVANLAQLNHPSGPSSAASAAPGAPAPASPRRAAATAAAWDAWMAEPVQST